MISVVSVSSINFTSTQSYFPQLLMHEGNVNCELAMCKHRTEAQQVLLR